MGTGVVSESATSLVANGRRDLGGNRFASGGGEKPAHQRFRFLPVPPSPSTSASSSCLVSSTGSGAFGRTSGVRSVFTGQVHCAGNDVVGISPRARARLTTSRLRKGIEASSDIAQQSLRRSLSRSERVILSSSRSRIQYLSKLRRQHRRIRVVILLLLLVYLLPLPLIPASMHIPRRLLVVLRIGDEDQGLLLIACIPCGWLLRLYPRVLDIACRWLLLLLSPN